MDGTELKKLQAVASDLRKNEGIDYENGKKYLEVSKRLDLLRAQFGDEYGIITNWGVPNEEKDGLIVKAEITNKNGFVVASGMAFCQHYTPGAVETTETKAIGRALACLGLSGGEYASADEMAAVKKPLDTRAEPCQPAETATDLAPPASEDEAKAVVDVMVALLNNKDHVKSTEDILEFHNKNEAILTLIMERYRHEYRRWSSAVAQRRKELKRG